MNRNQTKPGLLILASICLINSTSLTSISQTRPNVLFLFADDQRADAIGFTGNTYIKTPNIDKLAENGVGFSNAYVMGSHHGAVCAPSRAMLLSGKSLFNVYDKLNGVKTMPRYFAENGYITFGTGKWHNEKEAFETSFHKGENVFLGGMADHFNIPCRDINETGKLGEPIHKGFSTELFAEATISFLNEYAEGDKDQPFFCYTSFTTPHEPFTSMPAYIGMYPDATIPLPGNFKNLHPFAFDNLTIRDENLAPWPRTPEMIQALIADYYALITHMDDKVGEIIETLIKNGLFENTIIVYAADNGMAMGSHGLIGKQNLYEHSVKVPLIISGPGIPKNQMKEALVYLYDLFPTLSAACGLSAPDGIDGKDLYPVIKGESETVRNSLFTSYGGNARAVRTDEWKLIRYPGINHVQLFNLKTDPLEINNLAENQEYKARVSDMTELLKIWITKSNDSIDLFPEKTEPMEYDYTKFEQIPDRHQPEYILKKYFPNRETNQ